MMLADVSVLLSAFRTDSQRHAVCDRWLKGLLDSAEPFAVSTQVLASVLRISTNRRVFNQPSALQEAVGFCDDLLAQPNCRIVWPGNRHWTIFMDLLRMTAAQGDHVSDAWLAALAIEAGCEWITLDKDFSRYDGLKWRRLP